MAGLWGKRLVALIIDIAIITLFLWVVLALIYPVIAITSSFIILNIWIPIAALIIIGYFTYFEGKYSTTPGKNVMKLSVIALQGEMSYRKAFIRNLSKILWLPLIVDVIVGFAFGSPRERYLDRLSKTTVVKADSSNVSDKPLRQTTP